MKKTRALIPVIESVTVQRAGGKQVVGQVKQVGQVEQVEPDVSCTAEMHQVKAVQKLSLFFSCI